MIKEGEKVKVDPRLTGLDEWIEGTVIDIEHNPFKGLVIAIRDKFNRIFFGEQKYFIVKTDPESNFYSERIVLMKESELTQFLKTQLEERYFFKPSNIVLTGK